MGEGSVFDDMMWRDAYPVAVVLKKGLRMNVVLFVGEDTGRHQGCYGDPYAHTPHIDRLAAQGCRFTNAFSTAPVCAPSRSTLVTGQYACKIGSHHMRSMLKVPPRLFTEELRAAGYYVNWANKTDFNFQPPQGFTDTPSDWIAELERGRIPRQPFLLYFNFEGTHESAMWPDGAQPGREPPVGETGVDASRFAGLNVPPYLPDTPTSRASLVRYYDRLHQQDACLGRILSALDANGLADSTIVIYMSDHGRGLCREKRWLYEAGIHLPLVIRAPGMLQPGSTREDLVSWVDLAPTLHALPGLDIPARYDGRIFLGPRTQPEPACVFAHRDRMDGCFDCSRAARTRRHLYIRNDFPGIPWAQSLRYMETSPVTRELRELNAAGNLSFPTDLFMQTTKPAEELYDTAADPHCVFNLAGRADHAEILRMLRDRVEQWRVQIADKGRIPEESLIAQDVIADQRAEYDSRVGLLPERLRHGGIFDVVRQMPAAARPPSPQIISSHTPGSTCA